MLLHLLLLLLVVSLIFPRPAPPPCTTGQHHQACRASSCRCSPPRPPIHARRITGSSLLSLTLSSPTPRTTLMELWVVSFLPWPAGPAVTSALSTRVSGPPGTPLSRRQILQLLEMGMGRLRSPEAAVLHDWIQRIPSDFTLPKFFLSYSNFERLITNKKC